jgi:hypothetical protein
MREAVKGVLLAELRIIGLVVIDVVAVPQIRGGRHDGALPAKARVRPVLIERQDLVDPHPVTQVAT